MVPTSYYASGGTALTKQDSGVNGWDDVRGKPVCASQGSIYARYLAEHYGAEIKAFKTSSRGAGDRSRPVAASPRRMTTLLLYALIEAAGLAGLPADHRRRIEAQRPGRSRRARARTTPSRRSTRIIRDLHRSGRLIEIEKAWDITPSPAPQDAARPARPGPAAPTRPAVTRKDKTMRLAGTLLAAAALLAATSAHADSTLDRVKDRGVLTAGILVNGTAFGFLDPASNTVKGFNVDLAQAVADKLGVKLDIVTVDPPNRVQFLQQGKVDLLVASFTDTPERREQTSVIPTAYYEVGGAAMTRKDSGIATWEDLRGKSACASQGSHYARLLATEYGAEVRALKTSAEALSTLRAGGCVVSVHDNTLISSC